MHPTRTTTKLLLGVACAVSAVSGCVNVTPAPMRPTAAPGTPGEPPRYEPRGGPGATPVIVQAPALEALKAVPGRPAGPAPSATGRRVAAEAATPAAQRGTADRGAGGGAQGAPPVPDIPEPHKPGEARGHSDGRPGGHRPRHPRSEEATVPRELVRELPVRPADVCALGRRHGRWHADSPEARICAGVHGG
ncbi:hypothetical protein [Streptomyces sp. ISL-43]|uniref:hypothetical protein n=1 Tax=Streptomyces sp. ISL-43 TaxID=2819183 RepID=UPI0027E59059|nr:hypothetical protein [Streptomyces sp. ISL-43]